MAEKNFRKQVAEVIRDSIHNYTITEENELEDTAYFQRLYVFLSALEGYRNEAYLDGIPMRPGSSRYMSARQFYQLSNEKQAKLRERCKELNKSDPITTVGVGLNIESDAVRTKYDKIFGEPGLMERVYYGKQDLTDEQVGIILKESLHTRMAELKNIYGSDWNKLRANERICITSMYFNKPKVANGVTNFRNWIRQYVETNDVTFLQNAVKEVLEKSNKHKDNGMQNRRDAEGAMLASYECAYYTKPCDAPNAKAPKSVFLNKQVMPIGFKGSCSMGINADYFIWRTEMDRKVRMEHLMHEGKIYRKDHPPGYLPGQRHNCRCHAEPVPDNVLVLDTIDERKAFELYIRKGIIVRRENPTLN